MSPASPAPRHGRWGTFLRRLRYVVVDECHTYRGVFGSHVALLLRRLNAPSGVRFDRSSARLHLPGSPWPLLLILAIFLLKYAVGIELAMQPQAASEQAFVLAVAACYGALSGVFASRAAALWRLGACRTRGASAAN